MEDSLIDAEALEARREKYERQHPLTRPGRPFKFNADQSKLYNELHAATIVDPETGRLLQPVLVDGPTGTGKNGATARHDPKRPAL